MVVDDQRRNVLLEKVHPKIIHPYIYIYTENPYNMGYRNLKLPFYWRVNESMWNKTECAEFYGVIMEIQ